MTMRNAVRWLAGGAAAALGGTVIVVGLATACSFSTTGQGGSADAEVIAVGDGATVVGTVTGSSSGGSSGGGSGSGSGGGNPGSNIGSNCQNTATCPVNSTCCAATVSAQGTCVSGQSCPAPQLVPCENNSDCNGYGGTCFSETCDGGVSVQRCGVDTSGTCTPSVTVPTSK